MDFDLVLPISSLTSAPSISALLGAPPGTVLYCFYFLICFDSLSILLRFLLDN
jgi:hypothetical protein